MRTIVTGTIQRIVVSTIMVVSFSTAAMAAAYTIRDIEVQASGKNATEARTIAQQEAETKAFQQLVTQLGRPQDSVAQITPEMVSRMVTGYEVVSEKIGPTSYQAMLNVSFNDQMLRQIFNDLPQATPIKHGEEPRIVVPMLTINGQVFVWEEPNPWKDAWEEYVAGAETQVMVPLGDLGDISTLDRTAAEQRDRLALSRLAQRYNVNKVALAEAVLRNETDSVVLEGTLTELSGDKVVGSPRSFRVESKTLDTGLFSTAVQQAVGVLNNPLYETQPELAGVVSNTNKLKVLVPLTNIREWVTVRRLLSQIPAVKGMDIIAITPNQVDLFLHFFGDLKQLEQRLAPEGLTMAPYSDYWVLYNPKS